MSFMRQRCSLLPTGKARYPSYRRSYSSAAPSRLLARPVQRYISTSDDPYLNLSIEHYLLQNTSPDSAILFLYINKPSIIIGRNQNPWLEVNLPLLRSPDHDIGIVDLVRRRSGGGTVFHDHGNVNWSIIVPSSIFTRDKHAEMIVRALRSRGIDRARVNERHDVVLDQGERIHEGDASDEHSTPYRSTTGPASLKVSGSAYKLTRKRALHHGTCLLSSPNLDVIGQYLRSPTKRFITARGVESVSSPITNIGLSNEDFVDAIAEHFDQIYGAEEYVDSINVGTEWADIEGIRDGVKEMKSLDWTFLQTPQFTINTRPKDAHGKPNAPELPDFELRINSGEVREGRLVTSAQTTASLEGLIIGRKLHEIDNWQLTLRQGLASPSQDEDVVQLAAWLGAQFPSFH